MPINDHTNQYTYCGFFIIIKIPVCRLRLDFDFDFDSIQSNILIIFYVLVVQTDEKVLNYMPAMPFIKLPLLIKYWRAVVVNNSINVILNC